MTAQGKPRLLNRLGGAAMHEGGTASCAGRKDAVDIRPDSPLYSSPF
jgi:hypothetical protein